MHGRIAATRVEEAAAGGGETARAASSARIGVRLLRIGAGSALLGFGTVMLALPGPGWLTIALGLSLLAQDVAWAERALARVRRRLPTDGDGNLSRATIATMAAVAVATTTGSLWWVAR
jgi:hypothetical protein